MLGKYDPAEDYFGACPSHRPLPTSLTPSPVGATTEAKNQLEQFGRMAFGGAGMIVSEPLHRKLFDIWDTCHDRFRNLFGGELASLFVLASLEADCMGQGMR